MPEKEEVRIEDFKGLRVAYLRDEGPSHQVGPQLMRKLRAHGQQHNLHHPEALYVSIYNDDPHAHAQGHARIDAAVSAENFQPPKESELAIRELRPGKYAVYRHVGPYKTLGDAWARFRATTPEPGYKLVGPAHAPSFVIFRSDPAHTPEDQLITDLYQPVQAAG